MALAAAGLECGLALRLALPVLGFWLEWELEER